MLYMDWRQEPIAINVKKETFMTNNTFTPRPDKFTHDFIMRHFEKDYKRFIKLADKMNVHAREAADIAYDLKLKAELAN